MGAPNPIITKAEQFAYQKHLGQRRKYTDEPYISHCRTVAQLVAGETPDPEVVAAAFLHDTLEDTNTSVEELREVFGPKIATLVLEVTDMYTPELYPSKNRAARKKLECERIKHISPEAKLIKLCDLMDNTSSIVRHDPNFAVVYLREKADMLEAMGYGK